MYAYLSCYHLPVTDISPPRKGISLSQHAYAAIKAKIIDLTFPPGLVVNEQQLQTDLAIGRTPIREALQQLEREKMVEIVPRKGIFVAEINLDDLERLTEVRIPLEMLAVRLATERGSAEHWDTMANHLNSADPSMTSDELIEIDAFCHQLIYAAADNKFLTDALNMTYAQSHRWWNYALPDIDDMPAKLEEHAQMLATMQSGAADAAAEIMGQHIIAFHEQISDALQTKMAHLPTQP